MLTIILVVIFVLMTIVAVYDLVAKRENKISATLWYYGRSGVWTLFCLLYFLVAYVTVIAVCINL
jgi:cbb3-type cytochrome oxidase subunit 1